MGRGERKEEGRGKEAEEAMQKWRETVSMDVFKDVAKKWKDAGILLYAYNYSFRDNFSDREIERGFEMAKALGVKYITASSTVSVTKRVAPLAEKHKIMVAMHGHDNIDNPNEFATPETFEKAMAESKWIGINLDIGHFTAAGFEAVAFLEKHHYRLPTLHV